MSSWKKDDIIILIIGLITLCLIGRLICKYLTGGL